METFSAQLALCAGNSPVTGEFSSQRPVTRSFDVSFDLRMNKLSCGWWFETPPQSLWRHCNGENICRRSDDQFMATYVLEIDIWRVVITWYLPYIGFHRYGVTITLQNYQYKFNPSMDKKSHAQSSVGWNYLSIHKPQRLHSWILGMGK